MFKINSHLINAMSSALDVVNYFRGPITPKIFAAVNSLGLIAAHPESLTYSALAVVHLVVMYCYCKHPDGRPLAICAGLTAILYAVLAGLHGFAH
jgi:hypothetical protein